MWYRIYRKLTDGPVGTVWVKFLPADVVPDASKAMSQYSESGHKQRQYDHTVLVIAVEFL